VATTMLLRKALQHKNKLAGQVSSLNELIKNHNCHVEGSGTNHFDVNKLVNDRVRAIKELIKIKSAIAIANVPIYEDIYTMAELKASIAFFKEIPTRDGVEVMGYGEHRTEIKRIAAINAKDVVDTIAEMQIQIDELQDKIDSFNASHSITI
jgi:3-methyladenine DNA glycosylase AlkD